MVFGNIIHSHITIMDSLKISTKFHEVHFPKHSDVIFAFVRAGTDIQDAINKIPSKYKSLLQDFTGMC